MDDDNRLPTLTSLYLWPFLPSVYVAPLLLSQFLPTLGIVLPKPRLPQSVFKLAIPRLRWPDLSEVSILGVRLADVYDDGFDLPEFEWGWLGGVVRGLWRLISLLGVLGLAIGLGIAAPVMVALDLLLASKGTIYCDNNCFYIGGSPYNMMGFFTAVLLVGFALVVVGVIFYTLMVMLKRDERRHLFG